MRTRRPRTRPARVVGEKDYSSHKIRAYLRRRGIAWTIPECVDQISGRRGAARVCAVSELAPEAGGTWRR